MVNYREILRLASQGNSQRQIAASVHSSHHTVREVLDTAKKQGVHWPLEESVSNKQLSSILFPNRKTETSQYLELDFAYIHAELSKPKVTLTLLWDEYRQKAESLGKKPYMTTQFGDKYRKWAQVTKATMRIHHKPSDAMEVDWAGQTIPIYDSMTGEITPAFLFVAVLPCSGYAYAEATADMKLENWLDCHVHAYEYFDGVTRLLIPEKLEKLNLRSFTTKDGCRRSAYLEEEKAFMRSLPSKRYELATWNPGVKVGVDYLVSDGRNKYSVPFDLIGEKVDIRLISQTVEVFFHGSRVASHIRLAVSVRDPVINPDHMTLEHRKYLSYNKDDFSAWAISIGANTEKVVSYFLSAGKEAEQGFKACSSLTKLEERYGKKKLEEACGEVLRHTMSPSIRLISTVLKSAPIKIEEKMPVLNHSNAHGITRGTAYYSRSAKNGKDGDSK